MKHIREYMPDFALYEKLKAEWIAAHPNSTPEEYHAAMAAIAQRCGI
jgi:DNA-binding MurR/RpiR family transcriptional regulator